MYPFTNVLQKGRNFKGNCSLSVYGKAFGRIVTEKHSKKDNEPNLGRAMQLYNGKGIKIVVVLEKVHDEEV